MTRPARLAVRWASGDPDATRAALVAALGVEPGAGGRIELANATLEVVPAGPGVPPLALEEREGGVGDVVAGDRADLAGDRADPARPVLAGIGWATVDLERAAAAWPDRRLHRGAPEPGLGATTLVEGGAVPGGIALVLLEPATEGRLAATLARHGEGPAVLYVVRAGAGPRHLIRLPIVTGPHLILGEPPGLPSIS
ncbi:MAG: hypothetical protein RL338_832 [Chloroflexota bacterium]